MDLERLDAKLDKILDTQTDIQIDLANIKANIEKNTLDLEKHIRRTDLLEQKVESNDDNTLKKIRFLDKRVGILEMPGKVRQYLRRKWAWLAGMLAIIGTIIGIAYHLGLIK
jgi:hypothetical protein